MGLALKDSPPGFDPSTVVNTWGAEETVTPDAVFSDDNGDAGFAETEQL
jgi:DNA-directed RNA polymerase subunit alpha